MAFPLFDRGNLHIVSIECFHIGFKILRDLCDSAREGLINEIAETASFIDLAEEILTAGGNRDIL